jgi:type IV pilus assembly protein PilB
MIDIKTDIPVESHYDIDNDVSNRLGYNLLKKGVIDSNTLVKAVVAKRNESIHTNGNGKPARNLAQILVQDFKCDHDSVFGEVASLYAFRTFEIDPETAWKD